MIIEEQWKKKLTYAEENIWGAYPIAKWLIYVIHLECGQFIWLRRLSVLLSGTLDSLIVKKYVSPKKYRENSNFWKILPPKGRTKKYQFPSTPFPPSPLRVSPETQNNRQSVAWKRLSLLSLRGKLDFCFTFLRSLSIHSLTHSLTLSLSLSFSLSLSLSLSLSKTYQQINLFKFFRYSVITWWISYLIG